MFDLYCAKLMRSMKIFGKLVLAFAAASALTAVTAVVGILGIHRVQDAFNVISDGTVPELAFLGRLEASASTMQTRAFSLSVLASESIRAGVSPHVGDTDLQELKAASELFNRLMVELQKLKHQEGEALATLEQLQAAKSQLYRLCEALVYEVQHGRDVASVAELATSIATVDAEFREIMRSHIDVELLELEKRQEQASHAVKVAMVLSIGVAVLSQALAVMLGLFTARRVSEPLRQMGRTAQAFGEGVQDARVRVDTQDEIGELGQAFNAMADKLVATTISRNELVKEVRERHWAEIQAVEAKSQADAANKAKGQFLANMSHEIRTPLNAIIGFSELLQSTALSEDQARYAKTILASGTGLLGIINDILDFSKIEANERELESVTFNLRALVTEVVDMSSARINGGGPVRLVWNYASALPTYFQGDPTALRQILLNLVSNAIKFTEHGTVQVLVDASGVCEGGKYMVRLVVKDSGIGIPADKIEQVFLLFTQADVSTTRTYGGTGLGLAITRSLTELMGGSIECRSEVGQGSEFVVHLPLLPVADAMPAGMACNAKAPEPRRLHVLVAEDNPVNQMLARAMLEKLGQSVEVVDNGLLALERAETVDYDVILMDLHMPVMGGLEAAAAIRKAKKDIPIIALTAATFKEDRDHSLEAGMNDFLTKPLQMMELQAMLQKWA